MPSTYTLNDIPDRIRRKLSAKGTSVYTDAIIQEEALDAWRQFCRDFRWMRTYATETSLDDGTIRYAWPTRLLTLEGVRYDGERLSQISRQALDEEDPDWPDNDSGRPRRFFVEPGGAVGLVPGPDAALTIRYDGIFLPEWPSTDVAIPLPEEWEAIFLDLVAAYVAVIDLEGYGAEQHQAFYNKYESQRLAVMGEREANEPLVVGEANLTKRPLFRLPRVRVVP